MSYDKYIKYKNKYLQLKAKYTQIGGGQIWFIEQPYNHEFLQTAEITITENNALLRMIKIGEMVVINPGTLLDENKKKINDFSYIINSDGVSGTRSYNNKTFNMTLKEYRPPSTPPPPPR